MRVAFLSVGRGRGRGARSGPFSGIWRKSRVSDVTYGRVKDEWGRRNVVKDLVFINVYYQEEIG